MALKNVKICLPGLSFLLGIHADPGTKHVFGVICHGVSKEFSKKAQVSHFALYFQENAAVVNKSRLVVETLLLHFFSLFLSAMLYSQHKEDGTDSSL